MKTYFITSDTHSYFDELQSALKKKKFDINNPEHIFVLVGDLFDRGPKSLELYRWVKALPKERRILIRGNHEILFREMIKRREAWGHDQHNGTINTLYQLTEWDDEKETHDYYKTLFNLPEEEREFYQNKNGLWNKRKQLFYKPIAAEVVNWFASDEWINYWETPNYIFVHGFIPLHPHLDMEKTLKNGHFVFAGPDTYREDWRNATQTEWEDSTWFNWREKAGLVKNGINQTGKYIVVGHWHTSDLYRFLNGTKKDIYDCPIYKSKRYKIIGLDACTAGSGKVNILVLNENEL